MSRNIYIFIAIFVYILILELCAGTNANSRKNNIDNLKNNPEYIDLERRRKIAKLYLDNSPQETELWIDPHNMLRGDMQMPTIDRKTAKVNTIKPVKEQTIAGNDLNKEQTVRIISETDFNVKENVDSCSITKQTTCAVDNIYISRWLKMLILKIENNSQKNLNAMVVPLTSEFLKDLQYLSNLKTIELGELDETISNLIKNSFITKQGQYDWDNIIINVAYLSVIFCIIIAAGLFTYIFYNGIIYKPVFTTCLLIVVTSIAWHWMHLYQQRIAAKHAKVSLGLPKECVQSEFGLVEHFYVYLKSYFITSNCAQYYDALMVNPFWEVSLSVATLEALTAVLVQPLNLISKSLNNCVKQLFAELSIFNSVILLLFLFLVLIMFFKYKFRAPLLLMSLEPNDNQHNRIEDVRNSSIRTTNKNITNTIRNEVSFNESRTSENTLQNGPDLNRSLAYESPLPGRNNSLEYESPLPDQNRSLAYESPLPDLNKSFAGENILQNKPDLNKSLASENILQNKSDLNKRFSNENTQQNKPDINKSLSDENIQQNKSDVTKSLADEDAIQNKPNLNKSLADEDVIQNKPNLNKSLADEDVIQNKPNLDKSLADEDVIQNKPNLNNSLSDENTLQNEPVLFKDLTFEKDMLSESISVSQQNRQNDSILKKDILKQNSPLKVENFSSINSSKVNKNEECKNLCEIDNSTLSIDKVEIESNECSQYEEISNVNLGINGQDEDFEVLDYYPHSNS